VRRTLPADPVATGGGRLRRVPYPRLVANPPDDIYDPDVGHGTTTDVFANRLRVLSANDFHGYAPSYERIAAGLLADRGLLERLAPLAHPNHLPVRLFAAVRYCSLGEPGGPLATTYRTGAGDPWPPFVELLERRFADVAELVRTRTIQTNEVGRSAALLPALEAAQREIGGPLALLELGSSAGLNLLVDRYRIDYGTGGVHGDPASPVDLRCTLVGGTAPPRSPGPLSIASRVGIDVDPVDVTDDDACRWLEACVWPEPAERSQRLRAALGLARRDPPDLRRADALDALGPLVDAVAADAVPAVETSWVLAYLPREGRRKVHDLLAERGAHRDLALVTAEYPHITSWVPAPAHPPLDGDPALTTRLVLTTWRDGRETVRPLAWMHPHGRWLEWLASDDRTGPVPAR